MEIINFDIINPYLLYGWLPVILFISLISDLLYRRIPNLLTYPTIVISLLIYFMMGGINGLLFSLYGFLLAFCLFLIPYIAGGMGAGDVKLMGSVGAVLGWENTLISLLFIVLTGGVLSLYMLIRRGTLKSTLLGLYASIALLIGQKKLSAVLHNRNETVQQGIPYGVAITCGTYIFLLYNI